MCDKRIKILKKKDFLGRETSRETLAEEKIV